MNQSEKVTYNVRNLTEKSPIQKANESLNVDQSLRYQLLLHPHYSTNLEPSDIFLCPKEKKLLKRRRFDSDAERIATVVVFNQCNAFYKERLLKLKCPFE